MTYSPTARGSRYRAPRLQLPRRCEVDRVRGYPDLQLLATSVQASNPWVYPPPRATGGTVTKATRSPNRPRRSSWLQDQTAQTPGGCGSRYREEREAVSRSRRIPTGALRNDLETLARGYAGLPAQRPQRRLFAYRCLRRRQRDESERVASRVRSDSSCLPAQLPLRPSSAHSRAPERVEEAIGLE